VSGEQRAPHASRVREETGVHTLGKSTKNSAATVRAASSSPVRTSQSANG
jgi:hypothetical protein